jgi:hypothetical protein
MRSRKEYYLKQERKKHFLLSDTQRTGGASTSSSVPFYVVIHNDRDFGLTLFQSMHPSLRRQSASFSFIASFSPPGQEQLQVILLVSWQSYPLVTKCNLACTTGPLCWVILLLPSTESMNYGEDGREKLIGKQAMTRRALLMPGHTSTLAALTPTHLFMGGWNKSL